VASARAALLSAVLLQPVAIGASVGVIVASSPRARGAKEIERLRDRPLERDMPKRAKKTSGQPEAKRQAATPLLFAGTGGYGQHAVSDAPGFGQGAGKQAKKGVLPLSGTASARSGKLMAMPFHAGWLAYSPLSRHMYAAGDTDIHALALSADGSLTRKGSVDSLGGAAFLEISKDGRWLLSANYGSGDMAVFPLSNDGSIGAATDSKHHYADLDPKLADRQESCHPHQIRLDPASNKWALACDLGADTVWVYAFDAQRGALSGALNSARHLRLPAGSGPRHLDFHPNGKWVFVLCELSAMVLTCEWDGARGELSARHSVYSMPKGKKCARAHHSGTAHILVGAGGRSIYVTTRTDNCLVVFDVQKDGSLRLAQRVSTRGVCPRNFILDKGHLRLLNQDSQNLVEWQLAPDGKVVEPPLVSATPGVCGWVLCSCDAKP
jgi:6-phosphogluconolactonase (cycloisomerase 2 family)